MIWEYSDVCAKAGTPTLCQPANVAFVPCWRVRLSSQGRCSEGNLLLLPMKVLIFSVTTGKQDMHLLTSHTKTRNTNIPFCSFLIMWCGWCQKLDTRFGGPMICLFCCTVPVFLFNTALFVLFPPCLSPVQPGRAGEGSQQYKDRIESCWSCKYLKVSKVPYVKYHSQNQGHYIFYDKRKWAFFFSSIPFHNALTKKK